MNREIQKYISKVNLIQLLDELRRGYRVFVPVKKGEQRFYQRFSANLDNIVIGEVRPTEPLKTFFSRAREVVAEGFKDSMPNGNARPFAIVGVKACDLKALKVQDYVFKDHDYQDPFYLQAREENLIIAADCTCALQTCFCLALGIQPHPTEDFDINLAQVDDGFLVEIGSAKGRALVERYASLFQEAKPEFLSERKSKRKAVIAQVEDNIKENDIPHQDNYQGMIERKYESVLWQDEAKTCVECAACNTICPTCHCFLLYDQKDEKRMARLRVWDSCMIKDFARVAGGANPRAKLWMRLRNRFEKKFDYFPKVANVYACTGCGRCISACPAKIDIRKVLKKLVSDGQE